MEEPQYNKWKYFALGLLFGIGVNLIENIIVKIALIING